jgi:transposase
VRVGALPPLWITAIFDPRCPLWVQKQTSAADLLQEYEAKIAALERMVGRQALEIEFLKGALKNAPRPRNANTSVIVGPAASPSQEGAG